MAKACVFCGTKATLTNAHVLSQPIRAAFSDPSVTGSFVYRQSRQADGPHAAHSHSGSWVDAKARAECSATITPASAVRVSRSPPRQPSAAMVARSATRPEASMRPNP